MLLATDGIHQAGEFVVPVRCGLAYKWLEVSQSENAAVKKICDNGPCPAYKVREIMRIGRQPLLVGPIIPIADTYEPNIPTACPGPYCVNKLRRKVVAINGSIVRQD